MHISDVAVPLTCQGKMAAVDPEYGLRVSDAFLVSQMVEMKTSYDQLSRAAYLQGIGMDRVQAYEQELLAYGTQALSDVDGLTIVGTAPRKASILSFVMDNVHPHDAGTILDSQGVAVRTGQHCAQPVMDRYGITATIRASLGLYNTREDVDTLIRALGKVREVFG